MTKQEWTENECKEFWFQCCAVGAVPDDIPVRPDKIYEDEWVSWRNWFGLE